MATFHGKSGRVEWDCAATEIELDQVVNWSVDAIADVAEITDMGDTYKTYKGGFLDWTATVECRLDVTGLDVPLATNTYEALGEDTPAKLELYLIHDTVTPLYAALYGSAICVGVSINQPHDGVPTVTYTFQGNGTLAWQSETTEPTYE